MPGAVLECGRGEVEVTSTYFRHGRVHCHHLRQPIVCDRRLCLDCV